MGFFLYNSLATFLRSHDLVLLDLPPEGELNKNMHLIVLAAPVFKQTRDGSNVFQNE